MPRQDKTPKKKSKKNLKSPQESEESEDPAMDELEAAMNRLLQNAIDQAQAQAEQKFEERLKALEADRGFLA